MANQGLSELELLKVECKNHLQILDNIYVQSGFYRECLAWNTFKPMVPDFPVLPLSCDEPSFYDSMTEGRHCHFEKAVDLDAWKKDPDYNCGLPIASEEKWKERNKFGGSAEGRKCCMEDVQRMKRLFLALHFDCIVSVNLTAKEMKDLLTWAAKLDTLQNVDCMVVGLMSHGEEGIIHDINCDDVLLYEEVFQLFNNENCPALQGKPKLFFVQACRGGEMSCGTSAVDNAVANTAETCPKSNNSRDGPSSFPGPGRATSWSDMYIMYATIPHYVAFQNELTGSWLMSAVLEVFTENAHDKSLDWLMRQVHEAVMNRACNDGSRQTPCTVQLGWRKKLFFYPGRKC
ncbi:caspase-14-like isoform X2 [Amblyomma americanum]